MVKDFWKDLAIAQKVEEQVREVLDSLTDEYEFINVSQKREYRHKGDLLAINKETNEEICIEIKNDSRIHETKNVLLEYDVYYYSTGEFVKGNLFSNYEIYAVVSQAEQKIYFMDFAILKKIYQQGRFKSINHFDQITYAYLLPLAAIEKAGGLIKVVEF